MNKTDLVLHCGATKVDREQIAAVATPNATSTWQPIPHIGFIDQVEKALTNANLRVVSQAHSLTKEGNRYFGLLQVANGKNADDYAYVVGLRNSHDKSFPAGLVVGSNVFVCDNLSFSGEIQVTRKHTSRIMADLPILTTRAVGQLTVKWHVQEQRFAQYKVSEINDVQAHDFVIRSLDAGACTIQQIPGILNEWRNPRHQEFKDCGKTAWRLFNAYTENYKEGSLNLLPKRSISLHALLDTQVGLVTQEQAITEGTTDAEVTVR